MTQADIKLIEEQFEPFSVVDAKMKVWYNKETGEVIVIIFNPNIVGITKLADFLTLKADHLRNLMFWWKGRDQEMLRMVFSIWRSPKKIELLPCNILNTPIETFFPKEEPLDKAI